MPHVERDLGRTTLSEWLPIGPAPTLILLVTIVSGLLIAAAPWVGLNVHGRNDGDITLWTFGATHYDAYRQAAPQFEAEHGVEVGLSLINGAVLPRKYHAAARAGLKLPDLVEIENTWAGSLFRGSTENIPLVDVLPLLKNTQNAEGVSLYDRMVTNRFALYQHRGAQYGIPHDVHPVLLAYRRDIFEAQRDEVLAATGIDILKEIPTWDDFVKVARILADPDEGRFMIALDDNGAGSFEPLFYQRGGDFFDADGNLTIETDAAVDLITWMIPLVRDREYRVAYHSQWGPTFFQMVRKGKLLTFICPDWRCGNIEQNIGDLKGKLALMPLPAWEPGGIRTTTWGGTMLGISRHSQLDEAARQQQFDLTWEYVKSIYFDAEKLAAQMERTKILPPFKDAWTPEVLDRRDAYWSNQPVMRLYADVGDDIPARHGSAFLELAKSKMGEVITNAASYYSEHGEEGFRPFVREAIRKRAEYIQGKMDRDPF